MRALERLVGASSARHPFAERLPRRRPKAGWGIAVIAPLLITLAARQRHLLQRGRQGRALRRLGEPELFSEEVRAAFRPLRSST